MTDETRPFAVYDAEKDAVLFDGRDVSDWDGSSVVQAIEGTIQARERKAAAKALREAADSEALKDDFGHGEVITKHDVRTALRAEAAAIERGEVKP